MTQREASRKEFGVEVQMTDLDRDLVEVRKLLAKRKTVSMSALRIWRMNAWGYAVYD